MENLTKQRNQPHVPQIAKANGATGNVKITNGSTTLNKEEFTICLEWQGKRKTVSPNFCIRKDLNINEYHMTLTFREK